MKDLSWTKLSELTHFDIPTQKVRTNGLDCLFGSVIHFSRVFCSGTFVKSVSRKLSYRNTIFGHLFRDKRFWPQQCLLLIVDKIILERRTTFSIKIIRNLYCDKYFPCTFRHWFRRDRFWSQQYSPLSINQLGIFSKYF